MPLSGVTFAGGLSGLAATGGRAAPPSGARRNNQEADRDATNDTASAAFASLAHSFSQLLDCMEHPHEHNVTPKEMGDLLSFLSPRLLQNLSSFTPPTAATTKLLQAGEVKSSFPNEQGVYESQVLHEDWKRIVLEFSAAMQLDAMQSYHILETYLHLYHYNNISHFFAASSNSAAPSAGAAATAAAAGTTTATATAGDGTTLNLSELIHFYYTERCSLLQCISSLFRIYLDGSHLYHAESVSILADLTERGLEEQIRERYKTTCEVQMPKSASATTTTAVAGGGSSTSLFADDPWLAATFADQTVEEQALLLEILFLAYYENDAFNGESTSEESGASSSRAQTRFLGVYSLLQSHQFGRVQPLYPFLSSRGRATVDWIGHLSVLIGIELMGFEKLLRVYNHPIQELKSVIARGFASTSPDDEDPHFESTKAAALVILQESDITFREHPFHDLAFIAKVDHTFFEHSWNPASHAPTAGRSAAAVRDALTAPINLAWAIALSQVYEFIEDVQLIKSAFGLLGEDESGRPLPAVDFHAEKQIIISRLEASFAVANPFQLLNTILTRVQSVSQRSGAVGYAVDHAACNLPALKEIVHELLTALFQSSCYSALLARAAADTDTVAPIFPLFNRIFHDDAALAYRFWSTDEQHPEDRSPLFDQAIERFPIDANPLVDLLTALAGQSVTPIVRVGPAGETIDTRLASESVLADTAVCANRVFETLLHMKYISTPMPPQQLLTHIENDDAQTAQAEFNIMLTAPWTTPDGITLPAHTVGRFLGDAQSQTRYLQWWHGYSAWPLLVARLQAAWRSIRGAAAQVSSAEWLSVANIVQLMSKLVKADPQIYSRLAAHLQETDARANETAVTIYAPNATNGGFSSSTQQRELDLLVTLMRLQAFVSLHATSILAAANSTTATTADAHTNESQLMDTTFDSQTNGTLPLSSPASSVLTLAHLLTLADGALSLVHVAAQSEWRLWLRAFTSVMGVEMSSASSGLQSSVTAANLLSNVAISSTRSTFQSTYNYLHLLQRSLVNVQAPVARYSIFAAFLDHVATVVMPLYQLATIQQCRHQERSRASAFLPRMPNAQRVATDDRTSLPVNSSLACVLETVDMHHLLKYVCESVFIQYEEWQYATRSDRWRLGSQMMRLFLLVLSNATPPNDTTDSAAPSAVSASLQSIPLHQYLYTLFLTQPSMLLALLRPLLFGLSLLDRLNYDRHDASEVSLLQDLLTHTLLLLKKLLNLETQQAAVAVPARGSKVASFYTALLETVAAVQMPSAWTHVNRRRGGRFSSTPNSLLQAMTEYANYARSVELQSLAIQTIRLLCISGGSASGASTSSSVGLANFFTPSSLQTFRRTCLQLLTAHTTEISLKVNVLQLLATMFERQPVLAQRFAVSSFLQQLQRQEGKESEDDDGIDDDDSLFQVLKANILAAETSLIGDPQSLLLIYRMLAAIWQSDSATAISVGHFSALQTRLRTEVTGFWDKITHCITADVDSAEESTIDESAASTSLSNSLAVKLLRHCVWRIINAELFQSFGCRATGANASATHTIDSALESVLLSLSASARYVHLMRSYCTTSERAAAHRDSLQLVRQYHLDFGVFLVSPSSEEWDEGAMRTPTYNLDLIMRIMQLDLDQAFENEASALEMTNEVTMQDTTTSTSMTIADGRVQASMHRSRIEQMILSLKSVNHAMLMADAELTLMRSWRSFVQLCLQKQPSLLGIKPKSPLAFEYIHQLSSLLASDSRVGDGSVATSHLHLVSALLLSCIQWALSSDGTPGTGDLAAAILLSRSRSSARSVLDADDQADGETVFRATSELMANVAAALQVSSKVYVASIAEASGIVPFVSTTLAETNDAARLVPFDVTSRISTDVMAARVHATAAATSADKTRTPQGVYAQSQRAIGVSHVQHLLSATLLLTRWSNQLLMRQCARPDAFQLSSPLPPTTTGSNSRLASPSPMRRLDNAFGSPPVPRTPLAPVIEDQHSAASRSLIFATGGAHAATCQALMHVTAACVTEPMLADSAITAVPILMQAIDVMQGATNRQQQQSSRDPSFTYDQEPIASAVEQLRPLLPLLLRYFATMPVSQPSLAMKLVQLFATLAQYESGAELLIQYSVVAHICQHRIFHPTNDTPIAAAPGSSHPYHPSFAPYTPSHTRDVWHQVWVRSVQLLSTLLRSMSSKSKLRASTSLSSGASRTSLSAAHGKLLEEVLTFFNVFSSRLNKVLHLAHAYQPSVGSLEEIDAVTRLIYEFETVGSVWHRVNPPLQAAHRQQMTLLAAYYMRLMNDHRELEKRILVVSPEEKADAKASEDEEARADAAANKSDLGAALTRNTSTEEPRVLDRQKSDLLSTLLMSEEKKALDEKKRSTWRPLGASSGIPGSGASTPHKLSTPTTPRSSSTPSSQTPGPEERLGGDSALSRAGVMLSPVRGSSSFLLRSPVVGSMVNRSIEAEAASVNVGTGSITGDTAADARHASSAAQSQQGFAFFTQRIEFAMCLILRNCISYMRLQSRLTDDADDMRGAMFNHKIKVVNTNNATTSSTSFTSSTAAAAHAMMMMMPHGFHAAGGHDAARVGVTPREKIVQIFTGLGIDIESESHAAHAADVEFESEYYGIGDEESDHRVASHTTSSAYVFRPPLSMMIDFTQYTVMVLTRLFEVQKQSGLIDAIDELRQSSDEDEETALALHASLLPHSAHLRRGPLAASTLPSIQSIHGVMQFLLENALFIFSQHVQAHIARLKQMQMEYLAQGANYANQHHAAQTNYFAYGAHHAQKTSAPIEAPQWVAPPAAIRIGKLLDQYRDRISGLVDLLHQYSRLVAASSPSPPSLHADVAAPIRTSRLVMHLTRLLDEVSVDLAKHTVATRHMLRHAQARTNDAAATNYAAAHLA